MRKKAGPRTANSRRDRYAIIAFLLLVLVVWTGLLSVSKNGMAYVPKRDGVIDLRSFDFENNLQVIKSFENYDSWPQALYTPEDFARGVPGEPQILEWQDYRRTEDLQYATHRLTLLLPPGEIYALSMKTSVYAQRLYINGEEAGSVGNPATSREEYVPGTRDRTYFFTPQTERVEIIMQTANFVHGKSGCNPPDTVILGSAENGNGQNRNTVFYNALIIGCLLTAFLYHLSLFLLNRKRVTTLLFAVLCMLLALADKKLLFALFPGISWYAEVRFEYIVSYIMGAALIWFIYKQFPGLLHKGVVYPYCGYILLHLLTIPFDTRFFTPLSQYVSYVSMGVIVYILVRFVILLFRSRKLQNILGFTGLSVLLLLMLNDLLDNQLIVTVFKFMGLLNTTTTGMVFFVFCYALLIAIEYAETKRREEDLTAKTNFYRRMSHELLTPLTVVSTNIQVADAIPEEAGEKLKEAQAEIMKMAKMITAALEDGEPP